MATFNKVPKRGAFGDSVDVINDNFAILTVAIGELEFETRCAKGYFRSLEALGAAVPYPAVGDWAIVNVGKQQPAIYICSTEKEWTSSGQYYGGELIALNGYVKTEDHQRLENNIGKVEDKVDALDMQAVKARNADETDLVLGGVTMHAVNQSAFAQMDGHLLQNTLYVVVEDTMEQPEPETEQMS